MIPNRLIELLRDSSSSTIISNMSLLGVACTVHLGRSPFSKETKSTTTMSGTLLEVRSLWQPYSSSSSRASSSLSLTNFHPKASGNGPLYAFVRIKEVDHRLSGWFPLQQVELKDSSSILLAQKQEGQSHDFSPDSSHNTLEEGKKIPSFASELIFEPIVSSIYTQVTAGMARTQRAENQLSYYEERLLRDGMTPTTIRNFIYLNRYVFRAWYYAPYGLLNPEYDPVIPLRLNPSPSSTSLSTEEVKGGPLLFPNPYIRDAFLCPFSLRVFTTYEQMCYETRAYRGGRLRPPGVEIYRDELRGFSLFELNGSQYVTYCRHLFCIGKSFLENKLAAHDVHSYHFYVMALHHRHFPRYVDDPAAMYFAGYFTSEKRMAEFNLACILTLPCFAGRGSGGIASPSPFVSADTAINSKDTAEIGQLKGIGQFMIAVSYELAYRRHHVGTPERPFSNLGAAAYTRFWRCRLLRWFHAQLTTSACGSQIPSPHRMESTFEKKEGKAEEEKVGGLGKRLHASSSTARKLPRLSKRRNTKETAIKVESDSSNDEDETFCAEANNPNNNGSSSSGIVRLDVSIGEIAREIGLEEADVLDTVLRMGLIHYNAEDRSYCLMIPLSFLEWEVERLARWEFSTQCAVFNPKLLCTTKPSTVVEEGRHA